MIWWRPIAHEELTGFRSETMADFIGIKFTEIGDDYLVATMPVNERTFQPMRIMHGGASCVLAETLGSVAANCCVDIEKKVCVGLEINTSHIKMAKSGVVTGTARPVHIGKTTQLWEIHIVDESQNLISLSRLRVAVLDKN
jgi:1,4-dihydroxy-2-naphthoyl-CoA hydrolase